MGVIYAEILAMALLRNISIVVGAASHVNFSD